MFYVLRENSLEAWNFVDSVKNVIRDFDHVYFNWVHREANLAAHMLANWSLSQSFFGSRIWPSKFC